MVAGGTTVMNKKVIFGLIFIFIVAAAAYLVILGTSTGILAAQATGYAISEREQEYWITTGAASENRIACTKEQYYEHTGDPDTGRTDTLYLAIYEQNQLIPSKQKIIKVRKFKDAWDDSIHKRILKGTTYYRLVEEALEKADDRHSVFSRLYECYYKDASQMVLGIESMVTPYFDDVKAAKEWILNNNAEALKLKPLTIVDAKVASNWGKQGYKAVTEYSDESPEGLTYESIENGINK